MIQSLPPSSSGQDHKWKTPTETLHKVNTDIARSEKGEWGIGAIIKDRDGSDLAAAIWGPSMHG